MDSFNGKPNALVFAARSRLEKTRLRIRFTKTGILRWIGHRDLARVWERLLRRAEVQLAFSEGFHPKPKIGFPSALALGIEALEEVVELEIIGEVRLESMKQSIRQQMPEGMELLSIESLSSAVGKAKVVGTSYRIVIPAHVCDGLDARIAEVKASDTIEIQRDKKLVSCNTCDPHFDVRLEGDDLVFSIPTVASGSIRPSELLDHLGLERLLEDGATLQRTNVYLKEPQTKE